MIKDHLINPFINDKKDKDNCVYAFFDYLGRSTKNKIILFAFVSPKETKASDSCYTSLGSLCRCCNKFEKQSYFLSQPKRQGMQRHFSCYVIQDNLHLRLFCGKYANNYIFHNTTQEDKAFMCNQNDNSFCTYLDSWSRSTRI